MQKKTYSWQEALSDLITEPEELLSLLELDASLLPAARSAAKYFPLKVPRGFLDRIEKGNVNDPLLKQMLPLDLELVNDDQSVYVTDPLQEKSATRLPGLLHKYHGRVLITLTSACAIHCRYCFRRHFDYQDNHPGKAGIEKIMAYLANDLSIHEVILSGGDPLTASDKYLAYFTEQLSQLSHIKYLRFHTRVPIVLPERITPAFITFLQSVKQKVVMVLHVNHPNEINNDVIAALDPIRRALVPILNQSVLLKGVNDNVATLVSLSETLFAAGVMPYYLHMPDKVAGTAHFDLSLEKATALHLALHASLPGYLVPILAAEEAGKKGKTWLSTHLSTSLPTDLSTTFAI